MHLVQILLPVVGERQAFDEVMHELTEHDDIVVVEVMVPELDKAWWARYRRGLEKRLGQKELVVRAHAIVSL
jgi:hypothetical protein